MSLAKYEGQVVRDLSDLNFDGFRVDEVLHLMKEINPIYINIDLDRAVIDNLKNNKLELQNQIN